MIEIELFPMSDKYSSAKNPEKGLAESWDEVSGWDVMVTYRYRTFSGDVVFIEDREDLSYEAANEYIAKLSARFPSAEVDTQLEGFLSGEPDFS